MDTITIQVQHNETPFIKSLLERLKGVEKISVKEEIVGYTTKGNSLTASDVQEVVQTRLTGMKDGTRETYTHEEVVKRILKK